MEQPVIIKTNKNGDPTVIKWYGDYYIFEPKYKGKYRPRRYSERQKK